MRWFTVRQLKNLRRFPVPPEALEAGRRNLLIVMAEMPMASGVSRFRAFIWKPALTAFVVVVFVAVSGAGVVHASQGSLPGDRLYAVKLASEDLQERLTLSPEAKFAVQAEHAALRLEETQELMRRGGMDAEQRQARLRKAMSGFEKRMTAMDDLAAKIAEAPPKASGTRGLKAALAAERVLDRHAQLVASATDIDSATDDDAIAPIEDAIKLDGTIYAFTRRTRRDDGGADDATGTKERGDWETRRQERNDRLSEILRHLRGRERTEAH